MFENSQNVDARQASFTDVGRDLVVGQVVYNTNNAGAIAFLHIRIVSVYSMPRDTWPQTL
jgi:hypothetical protein